MRALTTEWVAVVGSRDFPNLELVVAYVNELPEHVGVVTGGARGVDTAAEQACRLTGRPVLVITADWSLGKRAGFDRNWHILKQADRVVAFWDGKSRGTEHTLALSQENMGEVMEALVVWPDGVFPTIADVRRWPSVKHRGSFTLAHEDTL